MAKIKQRLTGAIESMSPRTRQWLTAGTIGGVAIGVLWVVFEMGGNDNSGRVSKTQRSVLKPTNVDLMAPGAQVKDSELWIGKAGRELEQYKADREDQRRINRESKETSDALMRRFGEMEARLKAGPDSGAAVRDSPPPPPAPPPPPPAPGNGQFPPDNALAGATKLPPPPSGRQYGQGFPMSPPEMSSQPPAPTFVRVAVTHAQRSDSTGAGGAGGDKAAKQTSDTFLPVSFTRGVLLGGLDAPTGGQSQANPHPVLIRLSDNSVLPNRFRGEYRECFVVAAGYGDISSERAYMRTETLSCVRPDGVAMEVKIQGSVFGEDGKVGMRGRLVTKQGQMLANALMAGVMSGIGQGISNSATTYSTSPLGSVASTQGGGASMRAGLGSGVGKALDRLAQYYITLAEKTFPIIEVDAGRQVDVVLTKGVRIENGEPGKAIALPGAGRADHYGRFTKVNDDED